MPLQNTLAEFVELLSEGADGNPLLIHQSNMSIYANNVQATLVRTLTDIYPMLVKLLGKDFFYIVAKNYIQKYPSRSSNLNDYGQYFHYFLHQYQPTMHLLYLPEVAEFEWLCHQVYFAAAAEPLDLNAFTCIKPLSYKHLYLGLHPALRLKLFAFPIFKILALCENETDVILDLDEAHEPTYLKLMRRDLEITYTNLTPVEFTFLSAIEANQSVQQALQHAHNENSQNDPFDFEEKIIEWITDKTIVNLSLQET